MPIGGPLQWSSTDDQREDSQGDWDDSDGGGGAVGGDNGSDVDMDEANVRDCGSSFLMFCLPRTLLAQASSPACDFVTSNWPPTLMFRSRAGALPSTTFTTKD